MERAALIPREALSVRQYENIRPASQHMSFRIEGGKERGLRMIGRKIFIFTCLQVVVSICHVE